jgi:hypothetical protein
MVKFNIGKEERQLSELSYGEYLLHTVVQKNEYSGEGENAPISQSEVKTGFLVYTEAQAYMDIVDEYYKDASNYSSCIVSYTYEVVKQGNSKAIRKK